ncbi:preprotein translocase subunit SecG [Minisyncoccus archaeiphilus]|jgi:protein translocase SecG subunit|uniref:preprotein translocase subunit SecG n=1 Tax=Minisyncoccus archaeiphilus TaxID=3238481 RepID=UPI00399D2290
MNQTLLIIQSVVCVLIIVSILLQQRGTALGGAFGGGGGGSESYSTRRGFQKNLLWITASLIFIFISVSILSISNIQLPF